MSKNGDPKEASSNDWEDYEGDEEEYEDDWEDYEEDNWKRRMNAFISGFFLLIVKCAFCTVLLVAVFGALGYFFDDNGSRSGSSIPKQRIIAVKEVTKGGEVGLIGGGKKGPRGFMTAESKKYEVTYEDENGVIRTKIMSSDPSK